VTIVTVAVSFPTRLIKSSFPSLLPGRMFAGFRRHAVFPIRP